MKKMMIKDTFSTTSSKFQQKAYGNGILDPTTSKPPQDLSTIQHHLTQRRTSTQPSEHSHQQYCKGISDLYNEAGVSFLIQAEIMKRYYGSDPQYGRAHGRAITQVPEEDFNNGLSNPLPNILEGLKTRVLPSHLQSHSLHSSDRSLTFCHFTTEFKRTDGNFKQAVSQAAYDGATLFSARDRALTRAAAIPGRGNDKAAMETAVLTCVTDGKVAEVFAHHSQNGQYHQNLVARESLLSYPNRGRELIRNTQDYARSKSYELAALLGADLEEQKQESKGTCGLK
ncbi:hypothetical protein B0H67DRAFT_590543 [Lasiosphaeris hirsuta]|uniref:Uncharacterized protein n=1 Tax=Lasiosphaeris hirsuta TaxID=260670 RepID=A0AA40DPC4_9PEZI|nr:hypothetical protein B0H67DRAFT_590543 [Lasiosphaeris hirsuta]